MAKVIRRPRARRAPDFKRRTVKKYLGHERSLEEHIMIMVDDLHEQIGRRLVSHIRQLTFTRDAIEGDQIEATIDLIEAQFLGRYSKTFIRNNLKQFFGALGKDINADLLTQFAMENFRVSPSAAGERAIEESVRSGVGKIQNIQTRAFSDVRAEISKGLFEGIQAGETWRTIARRLEAPLGEATDGSPTALQKAKNRAKFIARNEVGSALGNFNKESQTSAGISLYIWQTSEDERVRTSHQRLNGKIFTWEGSATVDGVKYIPARVPNFDPVIPGQDYNCRCTGIPYIPEVDEGEGSPGRKKDFSKKE